MGIKFKCAIDEDSSICVEKRTYFFEDYIDVSFDAENIFFNILLKKGDAIKMHRELKKQISFLTE
tara:strand:- start:471 stop:665 length:195 start_codon:yes stop_codon:yes gene_type:complete